MTPLGKLAALGSGSLATASVAWMVATSTGYGDASQANSAKAADGPVVCVGQDSVLRFIEKGNGCPSGQNRLDLVQAEEEPLDWDDTGLDDPVKKDGPDSAAIAELERRVRDLEERPLFEVVNKAGSPVFRVAPGTALVFNSGQTAVAAILARRQMAAISPGDRRTDSQLRWARQACELAFASVRTDSHASISVSRRKGTTR